MVKLYPPPRSRVQGARSVIALSLVLCTASPLQATESTHRRLSVVEYRDKMKAGWIGQIAGVAWGAPTEFKFNDRIIPDNEMPTWKPEMINNSFGQDDVYVEMTFLRTMELYGLDCSIRQAGIDFANTSYPLWCANAAGRSNLRKGIAPPDSSHPKYNSCATIIDYQIESDYSGLIAPGMPNVAIAMGEKFGRLVNYGDGMYAGQFIGAMVAEAFFERDIRKVIEAGLRAIPVDSQYAAFVRDMLKWSREVPEWEKTWELLNQKYCKNPEYIKKYAGSSPVDSRINGAYALMGLLYGNGDPDRTIIIATRCGKDSDCNPSTAGGVLFTMLGYKKLPERFTKLLDEKKIFTSTVYNVPALLDVCEKLTRQAVVHEGGRIEKDANGAEFFVIPVKAAAPAPLLSSFAPGPIANSTFTPAEMAQITAAVPSAKLKKDVAAFAPGWSLSYCNTQGNLGLLREARGRTNVFATLPFDNCTPCVLSRKIEIMTGKKTVLKLSVADHARNGEWLLTVQVDGKKFYQQFIGKDVEGDLARKIITSAKAEDYRKQIAGKGPGPDGWTEVEVDLSSFAGKTILLELGNGPTDGYHDETAYWGKIEIVVGPSAYDGGGGNNPQGVLEPTTKSMKPLTLQKAAPFAPAQVLLLDGPLKQSRDAAEKHLLLLDVDRLLAPYRAEAGLPEKAKRYTGWETGSLPGVGLAFYLSGIANLTEANGNIELKRRLVYILDELAACQDATGGYLLGSKNGRAVFARVEKEGRFEGFSPWDGTGQATPYYSLEKTFSGLRDAYRIGHQPKALQIAIKLGNWLDEHMSHLTDAQLQKLMCSEYGGMNWVLADLYADTGDTRFLALSRRWVNHGVMDAVERGHDELGGRHANASIPQFSGLAARYPVSGVSSDRTTAEFFWGSVVKHHSYVNGGNSESENFCAADKLNNTLTPFTAENCNSYNMLRLTQLLFNIQPSVAYADYMERVLFNHILAAQDTDNGSVCYFLSLMTGTRKRFESEEIFSCCVCSGFDSYARTATYIYSHDAENLFVNLAVASEVTWPTKKLVLKQETRFPEEDTAVFRVTVPQATRFVLNLRYPQWATAGVTILVNGKPYPVTATPGSFVPISREWRNGDTVTVTTPLEIRSESMPDNPNRVALFAGPILLAGVLGPVADPLAEQPGYAPVIVAGDKPLNQWLKATVTPLVYTTQVGRPREVELQPFYKLRQQIHCIYWDCVSPAQWQTHAAELERLTAHSRDLDQRTIDRVVVGNRDSESARAAAVSDTSIGIGNNNGAYLGHLPWRHSNKPAGLGYTLKVVADTPLKLYCRYMGRATYESQRDFSIEVDGVVIAKVNMPMNNSVTTGVIEAQYNIPEELLRGKQSVRIVMIPDTKKTTGKLLEMRVIK